MTQEQGPGERRTYFTDLDRRMLSWMVFEYDERQMANPDVEMARSLGIDIAQVKNAVKRLEERGECPRVTAITLAVNLVVAHHQLVDWQKIPPKPGESLTEKEHDLALEFSQGKTNAQILKDMGINFEDFNRLKSRLFKKYGTRNRFFVAASNTLNSLKDRGES